MKIFSKEATSNISIRNEIVIAEFFLITDNLSINRVELILYIIIYYITINSIEFFFRKNIGRIKLFVDWKINSKNFVDI